MNIKDILNQYFKHPTLLKSLDALRSAENTALFTGINGSVFSFLLAALYTQTKKNIVIIASDADEASYIHSDLSAILAAKNLVFFPSSHKRSIVFNQPDRSNMLLRTEALERFSEQKQATILISYPEAIVEKVISAQEFKDRIQVLHKGEKVDTHFINELLYEFGFERVDFVFEPGQFSVRGSIIDIFSYSNDLPYRLDFWGDEIDSIRTFDILNQLSLETVESCSIVPEIQIHEKNISYISIFEHIKNPIFCIKDAAHCFYTLEGICTEVKKQHTDVNGLLSEKELKEILLSHKVLEFHTHSVLQATIQIDSHSTPQPAIQKNFDFLGTQLVENQNNGYSNYFITNNITQAERLQSIFDEINPYVKFTPVITSLHKGFSDEDLQICCYTDHEIFERYHSHTVKKKVVSTDSLTIQDLKHISPGDYIVHIDHGIGRFAGLERIDIQGKKQETIKLIYRDNDILYVHIHNLHKISKYRGKDGIEPTIHKLGSGVWQNTKAKTKSKVKDIAKELIALYAERTSKPGFSFSPDSYLQQELEASFFFEDTPDQEKATKKVKQAMEASYPMDMLVCGDVGFGKTEIAIRAAFKAVTDGKQVAVLVPTTILALQHFKTFTNRLKNFPCTVDYICRLRSTKQQKETIVNLKSGKTDIIIGTHRIIGKDLLFKDLGLLIIDEEQKFGVSIKEKLKQIKINVDTLTLTATPIPRTLQFSLMGARDLSIMQTPPPNRHPIVTEVHTFNHDILKEAILFEVEREGQVFIINNRIKNIYEIEALIQKLCPKVRTVVGHGQMDGEKLENIMMDFVNYEYDVLIATTIIESGLDIPNANTIIINDAHNFGLSDLHQLRGRVGRSNKKAYAYLLAPPKHTLTKEARQRLQAIEEFSDLGSGFNISMQDLDIRGAGNLLGAEQSGFISDIGYETYQKILDEALMELRENEYKDYFTSMSKHTNEDKELALSDLKFVQDCLVETDFELLFPDTYIESTKERVKLYRELDAITKEEDLIEFETKLKDRFGQIPAESKALFDIVRLRWIAIELGIERILLKNSTMIAFFVSNQESLFYQSDVFGKILQIVQLNPSFCNLKQENNKLRLRFEKVKTVEVAIEKLQRISQTT